MTNILLENDQPIAVKGLQHLISDDPELRTKFAVISLKSKDLSKVKPLDIILIVLNHRSDHSHLFIALKELRVKPKLILHFDEIEFSAVMRLLPFGLSGLVSQRSANWELVNCLQQVASNGSYICQRSAKRILAQFRIRQPRVISH